MKSIIVCGYAYPSIDKEVLQKWLPDLTFLNTFSYGITTDGELIDLNDQAMVDQAAAGGVKSLMVITPMDDTGMFNDYIASQLLENPEARSNLIENIRKNLIAKGMFGADFDFEYIPAKNKAQYVALVQEAKDKLNPEGYLVTVALAPKTSADQPGVLYEGHDYKAMGQAANLVLLMTYEWGYSFGPAMAISPINQVRKVLDYGISEIPPEKILMGVPNYGYDWPLPFVQGESRAKKISNEEGAAIAARYGVNVEYDQLSQSPHFNYTDEEGRAHEVWFEDELAIRAQLALIEEYDLAGAGYWNIMDYNPVNSRVLKEMYNIIKL